MPLPESHLKSLQRLLRMHDQQLLALHESLQGFTREIQRREAAFADRVGDDRLDSSVKVGNVPVLISQREVIEREIGVHETLSALGRDQQVLDTLGELLGSPDLAREAARDPRAFAKGRGIEIPANIALELDVDEERISLHITHYDELVPFVLAWNDEGFSLPNLDPAQAAPHTENA